MLLYHFQLTSNSSTPNLENRGLKKNYTLQSGWTFEKEGKLSSYCARTNKKGLIIPFGGDFTLCFRVKSKIKQAHFANLLSTGIINIFYHAQDSGFSVYAAMVGNVYIRKLFSVDDNLFHDIVITRESDVVSLFVDEEKMGTCNNDASGKISICNNPNYTKWDCYLQDIRLYDYCLSQQEIKEYSKALVLHYPLNGSELGNVVKDCSGFDNDYIKNAGKSYTYLSNSPRYSKHLKTNDENLKSVSTTSATQNKSLWCKNGNDWYFLANNGSQYVNGVLSSQYDNILSNATELSDLRIYATALSESDIKDLYNSPINFDKTTMNGIEMSENEQPTYDNKFHKTGVVKANEISEGTQCFNEKGITFEKIKEK